MRSPTRWPAYSIVSAGRLNEVIVVRMYLDDFILLLIVVAIVGWVIGLVVEHFTRP